MQCLKFFLKILFRNINKHDSISSPQVGLVAKVRRMHTNSLQSSPLNLRLPESKVHKFLVQVKLGVNVHNAVY